tara:strand:+ start:1343 stop:1510 length:168 start_codon:yes stop_codon:yes gene_type:complete
MPIPKEVINNMLTMLIKDFKFRIEASTYENDSDKWSEFHDYLREIRRTIKNGGIK